MSEKTSMFELLKESLTEEDIIKLVTNYDNKFNELEKLNKELNNRIMEAIEYIKNNCDTIKSYYPYINTRYIDIKTLLDILRGDKE